LQLNRKGSSPSIRRNRSKYQPKDLVTIKNLRNIFEVIGLFNKGKWIRVKQNNIISNFSIGKIDKHYFVNGFQWNLENLGNLGEL